MSSSLPIAFERGAERHTDAAQACDFGVAARRNGDRDQAVAWFHQALALQPTHRPARLELATTLREQGRLTDAQAVYQALLADDPGCWEAQVGLGLCARLRRDLVAAAEHLAAALAAAPRERSLRTEYATTLREQGRWMDAEAVYQALLDDEPGCWEALAGLGLCARHRRDLAGSAELLASALAAAPRERSVRSEYATTLREQGRAEDAEAVYRALLADEPESWQARAGLGLCARLRRNLPAAAEHLAAALARAPRERSLRTEYATTLREQGRAEEAEAVYQALLADEPASWEALAGLGLCARLRRDLVGSAKLLAAALAAAPRERSLRTEYATTLREQGQADAAEAVYAALLAEEPGSWQALMGLGLCARLRNERARALTHFAAASQAAPDVAVTWFELAAEYREAGRFDEARRTLAALAEHSAADGRYWLGLGLVERAAGDRAAALLAFRQAHHCSPDEAHFHVEIGIEEQALGQFAAAERSMLRAAEDPALAGRALTQLGEMKRVGHQLEEACELLRRAAPLASAPVWAHASLAQTLVDLGRWDEAFEALDQATGQVGAMPELALKRASLLRRAGYRREALAVARAAAALAPCHFPLWFEWFENERFSEQFDTIDQCLEAAPPGSAREHAYVHYARGSVAEQLRRFNEAAAQFRQAIALDGSLSWLHEALGRVSMLRFDIKTASAHLNIMKRLRAPMQLQQGLPPHLGNTHIGQILDEFRIDPAATGAAGAALAAAPADRAERLLALTRAAPEHTPTAIALLLALREAGAFATLRRDDRPAHASPGGGIPSTIVQYWDDATPPPDIEWTMASWRRRNPGHRYCRFNDASARAFLRWHCTPEVLRAYSRAAEPAMKADLFRLAYLFAEGGCYADADDRCLRPLDEWLPPHASFVGWQEDFGTLGNNFLAVAPYHPALGLALRLATAATERGDSDLVWLCTGPGVITRAFAQTLAGSALSPQGWSQRTVILDRHQLESRVAIHCTANYKNTRHWTRAAFGAPRLAARGAR